MNQNRGPECESDWESGTAEYSHVREPWRERLWTFLKRPREAWRLSSAAGPSCATKWMLPRLRAGAVAGESGGGSEGGEGGGGEGGVSGEGGASEGQSKGKARRGQQPSAAKRRAASAAARHGSEAATRGDGDGGMRGAAA